MGIYSGMVPAMHDSPLSVLCAEQHGDWMRVVEVSEGVCRSHHMTREQALRYYRQPIQRIIYADDVNRVKMTVRYAFEHLGEQTHFECRRPRTRGTGEADDAKGSWKWIFGTVAASVGPSGKTLAHIILTDTTKETTQMRANRDAVENMDQQVLDILDAICTAVFWKDKERRFLGANKAFLDYYGFPSESVIIGKTDEEMGWHKDNDPYWQDELRVLQTGKRTQRVLGQCMSHGEMRDIVASKSPIYDKDRHIVGLAGTFEDVTVDRRQHRKILELNEQLKASLDSLEKANQSERMFFANISHDMRTPMNAVLGFADLALRETRADKMRPYLQKIRQSGEILLSLINDTLDISRLANGKKKLELVTVDTQHFCDSLISTIKENAESKGVIFRVDLDFGPIGAFRLDPVRLNKILMNLLSNAVKFTPKGQFVTLSGHVTKRLNTKQVWVEFQVRDTGIGMTQEFLPKMYNAFEQEHPTENGTGIGLAIVKGLVQLFHGAISCESEVGKGTCFTVGIPVETASKPAEPKKEEGTYEETILQDARVLLCEDNALNQEIASTMLNMYGVHVDTADDGKQGVEAIERSPKGFYDAILMDIRMPVMDGLAASRAIRALPRADAAWVPIVALSANAFPEDQKRSRDAGMNAHLTKPLDIKQICKTLKQLITKYRHRFPKQDAGEGEPS